MESQRQPQWVVPNPQVPRAFGLLNIIFGVVLLLVGAGYLAWFVMAPTVLKAMREKVAEQRAERQGQHDAKIAGLKRMESEAKTESEKQQWKAERLALESTPAIDANPFDLSAMDITSDPRVAIYAFAEVGVGLLLNVLMIVSGAGLMGLANWGRRLALGVAWLKLLRWAVMTFAILVLVLPITTERMRASFAKLEAQRRAAGAAAPMAMTELARIMAIGGAIFAVVGLAVASIYPALTLWFLTRPRVRAACLAVESGPVGEEETPKWS